MGIDFDSDRARTFGYALYNIFKPYKIKPKRIDSLMSVIRNDVFFKTYTIGHPTEIDKEFISKTRQFLNKNDSLLQDLLKPEDYKVDKGFYKNYVAGFGDQREKEICQNIIEVMNSNKDVVFLTLIGRNHTYYKPIYKISVKRVALYLKKYGC